VLWCVLCAPLWFNPILLVVMSGKVDTPVLPYAPPRRKAPRPPLFAEVGCGSSLIGAILIGVALPWAAVRGFVHDGAPSLVGGLIGVLIAFAVGLILGALVVPAIVLGVYWIIWRIAGRP
jgi:hypothetical protein